MDPSWGEVYIRKKWISARDHAHSDFDPVVITMNNSKEAQQSPNQYQIFSII